MVSHHSALDIAWVALPGQTMQDLCARADILWLRANKAAMDVPPWLLFLCRRMVAPCFRTRQAHRPSAPERLLYGPTHGLLRQCALLPLRAGPLTFPGPTHGLLREFPTRPCRPRTRPFRTSPPPTLQADPRTFQDPRMAFRPSAHLLQPCIPHMPNPSAQVHLQLCEPDL